MTLLSNILSLSNTNVVKNINCVLLITRNVIRNLSDQRAYITNCIVEQSLALSVGDILLDNIGSELFDRWSRSTRRILLR